MISVNNLSKLYGQTPAIQQVSFSIEKGEVIGFLGPNGAGKTTILRCCAGILCPTHGNVLIDGHDIVLDQARAKSAP